MLQNAVDVAEASGVDEIVVVLGHDAARVEAAVDLSALGARTVVNEDFATGQASSLRTGLAAASPGSEAAVVLLADQPGIAAGAIRAVVDAYRRTGARVVRARYGGQPGHPVLLARATWSAVQALEGDVGARELIARHPDWVLEVDVPEPEPPDVDTPSDYDRLLEEEAEAIPGAERRPDPDA
jgi:CTP:molybdopterin cytidylyltransferase MocA